MLGVGQELGAQRQVLSGGLLSGGQLESTTQHRRLWGYRGAPQSLSPGVEGG